MTTAQITGTIEAVGTMTTVNSQVNKFAYIRIREPDGKTTTIENASAGNTVTSYLVTDSLKDATIHVYQTSPTAAKHIYALTNDNGETVNDIPAIAGFFQAARSSMITKGLLLTIASIPTIFIVVGFIIAPICLGVFILGFFVASESDVRAELEPALARFVAQRKDAAPLEWKGKLVDVGQNRG